MTASIPWAVFKHQASYIIALHFVVCLFGHAGHSKKQKAAQVSREHCPQSAAVQKSLKYFRISAIFQQY